MRCEQENLDRASALAQIDYAGFSPSPVECAFLAVFNIETQLHRLLPIGEPSGWFQVTGDALAIATRLPIRSLIASMNAV